ncbi:uncharacterized protein LOC128546914 [Mercenaria mercenaria]|uniref:uncharacterized protein LOC128546914 n=1 Tax=Mercenaria mercenaria TaxID=6596 RepID=UPI00234F3F43|nr:uncharacterized protein LOC128546914 [Mercenaria mercenaria]
MSRLDVPEPEAIEYLPQITGVRPENSAYTNLYTTIDEQENIYSSINEDEGPTSDRSSAGYGTLNAYFTSFKRVFSALLIVGDVLIDWTSLSDVMTATISDASVANYRKCFFSFQAFGNVERLFNRNAAETDNCSSSTFKLTILYGSFVLFGSVFALVKLLNIIGETTREICEKNQKHHIRDNKSLRSEKKQKSFGFQLLHGWEETFYSLLFEDLPKNFLLLLYSMTCKRYGLDGLKLRASMMGSFVKNFVRKTTCKQRKGCVCCLYAFDIGCLNFTCFSFVLCSSCFHAAQKYYPDGSLVKVKKKKEGEGVVKVKVPIEEVKNECICCACIELEWGCEVGIPPVCSCGRCVFIEQMGCCNNTFESKCCILERYSNGICGKRIDRDPIWLERYITLCYLINFSILFMYHFEIGTNLADMFGL